MRVVICGAGMAGLALAGRLHNTLGWEVEVLEKARQPAAGGHSIDFYGPGYDAAEAMGVLPWLEELSCAGTGVALVDDEGRYRAEVAHGRIARAVRGRMLTIKRSDLELALRERLSLAVTLRFGVGPERIEAGTDGVRVTLTDGTTVDSDLLVGADGVHSTVRALVFGEEARYVHHLGYHTASFVVDDPVTHMEIAGRHCVTDTPGRRMGLRALRDGTVAVSAVHRATGAPAQDARAALRREYGSLGWLVPRVLANCPPSPRIHYDHAAQVELPRWSHGRVVLVGDACQAVSPFTGQGASLAVGGAYVLADRLARASRVEDALHGYERLWRPVITHRQRAARRAARWSVPESPLDLRVRRTAVRLAALPAARRFAGVPCAGDQRPSLGRLASIPPWVSEARGAVLDGTSPPGV
ncbi:FAD-dependent monooxygenase [Streptomyces sp. NPDC059168]|uniref:FAD-dependent monooxygenase n=1 Tax=Streptomyces sp. NPDC059168 TaxID=3346753 RepID=UPI0036BBDD0E